MNSDKELLANLISEHLLMNDVIIVKHGHWIESGCYRKCSICNRSVCERDDFGEEQWFSFCPYCAARMDEEVSNIKKYRISIRRLIGYESGIRILSDDEDYSKYVDKNSELWKPYIEGFSNTDDAMSWIKDNNQKILSYVNNYIYPDTSVIRFDVVEKEN